MIIEAETLSLAPATQPGIHLVSLFPSVTERIEKTTYAPGPLNLVPKDIKFLWIFLGHLVATSLNPAWNSRNGFAGFTRLGSLSMS